MKSAIALCLLAVLCAADATFLNIVLLQVRNTKLDVERTMQQLEDIRDNVQQDVNLSVMKQWLQQREEYGNYVNPVLDTIRKEVEDAKARGKNAQPCYDAALNILKNIDYTAYNDAQRCQESANCSINNNLSFIDHLITTGRKLIKELDKIFPDCYEQNSRLIDTIKLYNCVKTQLGITKDSVKNLKTDASSVKSTAKNASSIVLQQSADCFNNVYSRAHSQVTDARSAATRCLANSV